MIFMAQFDSSKKYISDHMSIFKVGVNLFYQIRVSLSSQFKK